MKNIVEIGNNITKEDLIVIENGTVTANTKMFKEYATKQKKHNEKFVSENIGMDFIAVYDEEIKSQKTIVKNAKTFRTGFTEPLRSIASKFTLLEKGMDENIQILEKGRDDILEVTYQIAEDAIKEYLDSIVDKSLGIDLSVFNSFIEKQRKLKTMLPKEDGILPPGGQKKIQEEYEKLSKPILEQIQKNKLIASEQLLLDKSIPDINLNNVDELEVAKIKLEKVELQIPELFSNIKTYALNIISSKIYAVESDIKAIKADAARKEEIKRNAEALKERDERLQLEKEREEKKLQELREIDSVTMSEVDLIAEEMDSPGANKETLAKAIDSLREKWSLLNLKENKDRITREANKLNIKIQSIEKQEREDTKAKAKELESQNKEIVSETFTVHGTVDDMKALVKFLKERGMRYE